MLEFDEFLKIPGCKKGRHVFVAKSGMNVSTLTCLRLLDAEWTQEVLESSNVECRIDHYQTPKEVIVSVFAKQVNKESSTVTFNESQVWSKALNSRAGSIDGILGGLRHLLAGI